MPSIEKDSIKNTNQQFYDIETYPINTEQATGHGRTVHRFGGVFVSFLLTFWYRMPIELQVPIETANINSTAVVVVILERGIVDDIDDWTHHGRWIACDAIQKWFQPTDSTFAMGIKIG